jgi:DNA-binding transcriptional MocR family regulator
MWTANLEGRSAPLYLAIADAIAEDIASGGLQPGARLPTHRDLAYRLRVTVGTVTRAYAEAERRRLVSGEVGRGTFVRCPREVEPADSRFFISERSEPDFIDMGLNLPPIGDSGRILARTLIEVGESPDVLGLVSYQPDTGMTAHRRAGAEWLARAGMDVDPERVVVCNGAQHGVLVCLMATTRPGDLVLTETLTYPAVKAMAEKLGLRLQGVPMDAEGLLVDGFENACRLSRPQALYCQPTLHNPTTAVMSRTRREQIAEIAARFGVSVIEDDVYGYLPPDRPPPMAAFAPDLSYLVNSASKSMAPGLRVGFIMTPKEKVQPVRTAVRLTNWMTAPLMAEIARRWIENGTADSLVRWHRSETGVRQQIAANALEGLPYRAQSYSYHLWLPLPDPWTTATFVNHVEDRGVRVMPAETFAVGREETPHAVRVCLGAASDHRDLDRGLHILAKALNDRPPSDLSVI